MISLLWSFTGFIVGLLVTSVFSPPLRDDPKIPTPNGNEVLHTKTGCVKFRSVEVPCDGKETSLNIIAAQHK